MSCNRPEKWGHGLRLKDLESYHRGNGEARKMGRIQKSLGKKILVKSGIKR